MLSSTITFLLPGADDLDELRRLDPDRAAEHLVRGERIWVLQAYLRLRAVGEAVELAATPPAAGWVVFHAGDRKAAARLLAGRPEVVSVGVRGDRHRLWWPDFEIVQNRAAAGGRRFYVPHWPQPGLLPRDPARGERLENVAFVGFEKNLAPAFTGPLWRGRLAAEGLDWRANAVAYDDLVAGRAAPRWHDYRDTDAVVAIRPHPRGLHPRKPATKLYNAWLAGVPALLGPEIAYRELRRSPLDYFEVATPEEALAALARLRDEPGLYRAMVEHGRRRGEDFRPPRIVEAWRQTLGAMRRDWRARGRRERLARFGRQRLLGLRGGRRPPAAG